LRVRIPPSQVPGRTSAWTCRLIVTLLAQMISRRFGQFTPPAAQNAFGQFQVAPCLGD